MAKKTDFCSLVNSETQLLRIFHPLS